MHNQNNELCLHSQHSSPRHHSCSLHCWSRHYRNHCRPMQHYHNQELTKKTMLYIHEIINGIRFNLENNRYSKVLSCPFFWFLKNNIVKTSLHEKSKLRMVEEGFWVAELQVRQIKIGHKSCFEKFPLVCTYYFFALDPKWPRFLLFALYDNLNPVDVPNALGDRKWNKSWLLEEIWHGGGGVQSQ